jgi:hypothetical protein
VDYCVFVDYDWLINDVRIRFLFRQRFCLGFVIIENACHLLIWFVGDNQGGVQVRKGGFNRV